MSDNKFVNLVSELFSNGQSEIVEDSSEKTVIKINLKEGKGVMTSFHLFPGIDLVLNDFSSFDTLEFDGLDIHQSRVIEINHCYKGRYEFIDASGKYGYMGEGDLAVSIFSSEMVSSFPLGYYQGVELMIDMDVAGDFLAEFTEGEFDLNRMYDDLRENNNYFLFRASKDIEHVISELYNVDGRIKYSYYKLKIIELLLFIEIQDISGIESKRVFVSKKNAQIIREVCQYLSENLDSRITLDLLVDKFNISKTTIKDTFKAVYGKSIFSWWKEYKLNKAAHYLKETDMKISDIAGKVGYTNSSKFAAAFKEFYGLTPSQYRKQ